MALSPDVFGRWLFSHEEDGASVYRPRGSQFAPTRRPRDGFDIEPDGHFRGYTPGPTDASQAKHGRWTLAAPGRLEVTYDDAGPGLALEIVDASAGMLRIRQSK